MPTLSRTGVAPLVAALLVTSACGPRLTQAELEATSGRLSAPASSVAATASTLPPDHRQPVSVVDGGTPDTGARASAAPGTVASEGTANRARPAVQPTTSTTGPAGSAVPAAARKTTEPAQGPPATGSIPAPKPEGRGELRLGSVGVASGILGAVVAPIPQTARAWAADINARGGVAGHKVVLIQADDRGDPAQSLALVRRLVEQDKVQAFYANFMPTTEEAIVRYLEEKKVPSIGGCSCSSAPDTSPMLFPVGPGAPLGESWAHVLPFLAQTDKRKISLLYCREAAICNVMRGFIMGFAKTAGFQIVHEAQVSIAQPDYTAEVLAARNAGADVVVGAVDNASLVRIAKSARRQGWNPVFSIQHSGFDDALLAHGTDADGIVTAGIVPDHNNSPKLADYRAAVARYVPGGRRATIGAGTWVAGKLIEHFGASLPDQPTSASILDALYALKGETLGGLLPPTTYEAGKGHAQTNLCIIPVTVRDEKFVAPNGDAFTCAPGWKPVGS